MLHDAFSHIVIVIVIVVVTNIKAGIFMPITVKVLQVWVT